MKPEAKNSTQGFFRQALAYVRAYPLDEAAPGPALGGWPDTGASRSSGDGHLTPLKGEVHGVSGDLWSLSEKLRSGVLTIEELAAQSRERIARYNSRFGAFEYVADTAGVVAQLAAEARNGRWRSPLHGLPLSIKDVIHVQGMPTTGSSAAYPKRIAPTEGIAVRRLRAAGAVFVGKATSHEFALGVTTPQARNPWDERRIPGGSSGGSAISIVTGMASASLGTDTRASIRVPAALTGTVGFKPSLGRVPVDGLITLSWSMDHIAPMGRSVRDIALLMDVLTASPGLYTGALPGSVAGRQLVYSPAVLKGCDPAVAAAFQSVLAVAADAGAEVSEGPVPSEDDLALANAAGMIVSRCEAAGYHRDLGTDLTRCTPETATQLQEAANATAVDYLRAQRLRNLLRQRIVRALDDVDALIMPTAKVLAPRREEADQYLLVLAENCIPWSFIGLPAISLPAGLVDGLPAGIQLVGRPDGDVALLALAHGLERLLPPLPLWHPPQP